MYFLFADDSVKESRWLQYMSAVYFPNLTDQTSRNNTLTVPGAYTLYANEKTEREQKIQKKINSKIKNGIKNTAVGVLSWAVKWVVVLYQEFTN